MLGNLPTRKSEIGEVLRLFETSCEICQQVWPPDRWESARRPGTALSRSKHEAYDASYAVPLTSKDKRRLAR